MYIYPDLTLDIFFPFCLAYIILHILFEVSKPANRGKKVSQ